MAGLKDDPANNIASNCFNVTREILSGIFQPLVADINALVRAQVDSVRIKRMDENHTKGKEIKAIFLVGGFVSSIYLKECLQKHHPDIQIIILSYMPFQRPITDRPRDSWSAIFRGAVLSKAPHEANITSTVATQHYGVAAGARTPWQEEDEGQPKFWDSYEERYRVLKMTWFINTGEDLQRTSRISFPFFRQLEENYTESQLIFRDELTQSDAIKAPKYPARGLKTINCVLEADFRGVSKENFRQRTRKDGSRYYEVHYNLNVTFATAMMRFTSEMNAKEMGAVEAKY